MKKLVRISCFLFTLMLLITGCSSNNTSTAVSGTYTGKSEGFGGEISVDVTLEDGKITDINTDLSSETESIGQVAGRKLIEKIIEEQSIAFDTTSGATKSTGAILDAVKQALESANVNLDSFTKEVSKKGQDEEISADVVVVGTGGAGTSVALLAAAANKNVVIIEKNSFVGGNTKLSHGFFAIESKWQKEKGIDVSVDEAVKQLLEFNNYLSNGPLTRAIVEKSAETVEWIDSLGMKVNLQEGSTQFAHLNDNYKAQAYHIYENTDEGFKNLYDKLEELGAKIYMETSMESLIYDDEGVKGIFAKTSDGATLKVNAKAVMVATGGFGGNIEKINEVTHKSTLNSLGVPNMGEGLDSMIEAGAVNIDGAPLLHASQLAESEVTTSTSEEHLAGFSSSPITQLLMSPLLWVDPSGSRFVNEDVVYDTAYWSNAAYAVGGKYYFVVDKATLEAYTAGSEMLISMAGPGANMDSGDFVELAEQAVSANTAFKGETLEELAENAGMNKEDLIKSVESYNMMVANKKDTDYAKSKDSLLYSVSEGPFYAFDCRGVYLGTIGGVRVNEHLEVLDENLQPIKGLYTGGANAGGYYHGEGYPPYEGLASGFTWTSGRIAGESILKYLGE